MVQFSHKMGSNLQIVILIVISLILQTIETSVIKDCKSYLKLKNKFYKFDDQKNITGIPADMHVHWETGNVYFTLIDESMKMKLKIYYVDLDEVEDIHVNGLGQSTTVDNVNDIIYLATDNGVYKYQEAGNHLLYAASGEDVMYVAVNNDGSVMYIATFPQNRVQKITEEGRKMEPFAGVPNGHGLTIDSRNNIYFVATKTSYVLQVNNHIPVKIRGLPRDMLTGFFVSRTDDVYAMDDNSNLYSIDGDAANHLGSFGVKEVNTFAMDQFDNVLIGVNGGILKYSVHDKFHCPDVEKSPSKKPKRHNKKRKGKGEKKKKRNRKKSKRTTTTSTTTEANDDDDDDDDEDLP